VQLYRDLAAIVKNDESKKMFQWLVQQESAHKQRFEDEYRNFLK
jgi:rubrerythrin